MPTYDYPPDQLVKLSDGRVMTWAEFQRYLRQQATTYTQQMTTAIEQLSGLADQMHSHAGEVSSALHRLTSDMSGIEGAMGTDEIGAQVLATWQQQWPNLRQVIEQVATVLGGLGDGLEKAADVVFQTEQSNLQGLSQYGVHVSATDPRKGRSQPRRGPS